MRCGLRASTHVYTVKKGQGMRGASSPKYRILVLILTGRSREDSRDDGEITLIPLVPVFFGC
jgi:hypothetical protein